ncbi:MAG: haloacid dehalogenase-like hydrolase [Dehalococcoidia bacterium]
MVILCDFDDTAADRNIATLLLDRFQFGSAPPGALPWRDLHRRFLRRELSLAEYQELSFRDIGVPHAEQAAYVQQNARLRPGFAELAAYCVGNQIGLAIVSHGLDFYIQALLEREGLGDVPFFAVRTGRENGATTFEYTFTQAACDWWPGNCKCRIVDDFRSQGHFVIYAGDGASDACPAQRAGYVFARDSLLRFCRANGLAHQELTDFHAVLDYVKTLEIS